MARTAVYRSSPIRRVRRTKSSLSAIREAISGTLEIDQPMTVRQVFYRLVSTGVISKTEAEYKNTVVRLLGIMRREKEIPFGWISDSTRWMRKPRTYSSLEGMLESSIQTYRRDIWDNQSSYVEIWLEKEALAGVLYQETERWHVPLMVTRGYPSLTYLYEAADAIAEQGRPCYLYYFGDLDPSGVGIPRRVERDLRDFAPDAEIHFERVAVTRAQVARWELQTRPTKRTDSRARNFEGESVEVDAIPPARLRELVSGLIEQHVDGDQLQRVQAVEDAERDTLRAIMGRLRKGRR